MAKKVEVNRDWCKGCGICQAFCPKQVLELDELEKMTVARPEDCNACGMCEQRCPDLACALIDEDEIDCAVNRAGA